MYATMINTLDDPDAGTAAFAAAAAATGTAVGTKASRRDRDSVTSRLKFLWDAYRTVLDVLRNNARLELLYQQTVAQAFAFCLRNARKNEFRRLCETLRLHLAGLPRAASQHNGINLSDPEVLQRFLDTRFLQLQTANDMELWQESFRSAEDIYQLLVMAGSLIAPNAANTPGAMAGLLPAALFTHKRHGAKMTQMVAQYYQKMTQIFTVSEDRLFLAAAWNKYQSWVGNLRGNAALGEQELARVASHVVVSALAAPVFSDPVDPDATYMRFNRKARLAQMLGMPDVPDRDSLLRDASAKGILGKVPAHVRGLYEAMEAGFHPLMVAEATRPHLAALEQDAAFAKYVPHLRTVIVASVLKNIASMYSTISLPTVLDLTSVSEGEALDLFTLERVVLLGNQKRQFNIKINYLTQTLEFVTETAAPDLASLLELPLFTAYIEQERHTVFERARESVEQEHQAALARQAVIEQKKIAAEQAEKRKVEEETRARQRKVAEEREALQKKMADEAAKREVERLEREREEMKRQEARKIAEALKAKSGMTIADEDLDKLDPQAIFALQAEQIRKERELLEGKMKALVKRADHFERAMRKEEIPLLHKAREEQKIADKLAFDETRKRIVEEAKERHATAVSIKHRVLRMLPDYQAYRAEAELGFQAEINAHKAECAAKIEAAKAKRREEVRAAIQAKIAEKKRKEEEAEAMRLAEAEAADEEEDQEEEEQEEERPKKWAPRAAGGAPAAPAAGGAWTPGQSRASGAAPAWKQAAAAAPAPAAASADKWRPRGAAAASAEPAAAPARELSSGGGWRRPTAAGGADSPAGPPSREGSSSGGWRRPGATPAAGDSPARMPPREGSSGGYVPPSRRAAGDAPGGGAARPAWTPKSKQ
ncbi:hypothetical protein BCR44DRAFT_1427697 [Catenaria anguillulae PL171]|uniref:eIF3a PCI domain-containing protein n=1 Tax=Catenaria anguillulae PL171 TaxID=765915 RepID=A0A1Y2HZZ4_9FUNG|nr:hypothetical protein BCR44DRAFT_1427697 [Catenaria anguillulae PL171]